MFDADFALIIAVLGVLLAGFSSHSLGPGGEVNMDRRDRWRVRFVMTSGFNAAIAALGVVAIAAYTDDSELLVRLAMGLVLLITLTPLPWALRSVRDREVFRSTSEQVSWLTGEALFRLLVLVNLTLASEPLAVVVFVVWIFGGASVFLNRAASIYPPAESTTDTSSTS